MGLNARLRTLRNDLQHENLTVPLILTPVDQALRKSDIEGDDLTQETLREIGRLLDGADKWLGVYIDKLVGILEELGTLRRDIGDAAEGAPERTFPPEPMIGGEPVDELLERIANVYKRQGRPL